MKSYKFLFENINNVKTEQVGFRTLSEMSMDPFELLPSFNNDISEFEDNEKNKQGEYELSTKLHDILSEMDLMGDGLLDVADFSTAIMSVIADEDTFDFMSISMKIFGDDELAKDEMDSAKIEDIISLIVNSANGDIVELKRRICESLQIEYNANNEDVGVDDNKKELETLELAEKIKSDEPYKPMYTLTSGIQKFGKKTKENKKNDDDDDEKETELPLTSLKITTSIKGKEFTDILDKMHIYLFHAVHDVKQIPMMLVD